MSTSEQNDLLQHVGFVLLDNFCTVTTCTLLYGVFIFLFSMSSASLLRRGLESRSTRAVLLLTVISFVTATMLWVGTTAVLAIQIHTIFVANLDVPLLERYSVISTHNTYPLRIVTTWASGILPIISDIVVIWRAWIIFFQNRRWVMIGPLVLLLGTIATTLASQILFLRLNQPTVGEGIRNLLNLLSGISIGLSLGTNASATLAIGFALWSHRGNSFPMTRLRLLAQNILFILVESGVLYFVLQLITLILILYPPQAVPPGSAADIAGTIFYAAYYFVSAMYPTIVVVLVNQQRSFVNTWGFTIDELNTRERNSSAGRPFVVPTTKVAELESRDTDIDSRNFAVLAAPV